jgi:peptide/nickel transport system substrate-binding protein
MHRYRKVAALCITVASVVTCGSALVTVAPASASTKVTGSTAYWAEAPSSSPNFIFPFMAPGYFTTANVEQFQDLMYRPLYWMGNGSTPDLNPTLSLAKPPVYGSGNTVTITLKTYKWSNGESVDARDVIFWMNMLHAEKDNWAAYAPGAIPDNVVNVVADSSMQLTFTLDKAYNPDWFTYNELSQITPMPLAWDVTTKGASPGSGKCSGAAYGTLDLACDAVYNFLSLEAGSNPSDPEAPNRAVATYGSNRLWQVVDGPWRLKSLSSAGTVTMTRNPSYSGPHATTFSTFVELPFASAGAEQTAVTDGRVDVGYLPLSDVTTATSDPDRPAKATAHRPGVTIAPLYPWAIDDVPYNFNSTGDGGIAGKIFSQLYFRQAVQMLVDQPAEIRKVLKGYGLPSIGPVPLQPASAFTSGIDRRNPYPYDPAQATALLEKNGWDVRPGGVSACERPGTAPGDCGAWIPSGASLRFTLVYASGAPSLKSLLSTQKAAWAGAGIDVTLQSVPSETLNDDTTPCVGGSGCTWELEDPGTGWTFYPDVYPSGEEIFGTGAGTNVGSYADLIDDGAIADSETGATGLGPYFSRLAAQLPAIFEPVPAASLTEIKDTLRGVTPQNVLGALTPESWSRAG